MIKVSVVIGIGAWTVRKTVKLCACPHVGDMIDVDGVTVTCEVVCINARDVNVREAVRFASEADLDQYLELGWTR